MSEFSLSKLHCINQCSIENFIKVKVQIASKQKTIKNGLL